MGCMEEPINVIWAFNQNEIVFDISEREIIVYDIESYMEYFLHK